MASQDQDRKIVFGRQGACDPALSSGAGWRTKEECTNCCRPVTPARHSAPFRMGGCLFGGWSLPPGPDAGARREQAPIRLARSPRLATPRPAATTRIAAYRPRCKILAGRLIELRGCVQPVRGYPANDPGIPSTPATAPAETDRRELPLIGVPETDQRLDALVQQTLYSFN